MQENQRQIALAAFQDFLNSSLETLLHQDSQISPESAVLELFNSVITTVPAYQDFLAQQNISPAQIQTFTDFQKLPPITKENYLLRYPLGHLCRTGKLETCDFIAVSSGSTGKPTFWPRFFADELQIAPRFEQIFRDSFCADISRTLAVICFSLGTWVGGIYTTNCCRYLASKGYQITVVTPGNNKEEIFRVIQELGPEFEQVVLLGYPPFIKDIIDQGIARGIEWNRYQIKMVFAGEVFSEEWRNLIGERTGGNNSYYQTASLYGTADAGILGNETPLSICIRRFLSDHPEIANSLFGEPRLPTLVQYDPFSRFFEIDGVSLLFSGNNGIPLIRYNISDTGGLVPYQDMLKFLDNWGFDPIAELQKYGLRGIRPLPFLYIFGRSNFTVSYFGANIYPENITVGLEQPLIQDWVTGKFVLQVKENSDQNKVLSVVVELAPGIDSDRKKINRISESILAQLKRLNSEFTHYVPPEYHQIEVSLAKTADPEYFPIGVKHRYTRSTSKNC